MNKTIRSLVMAFLAFFVLSLGASAQIYSAVYPSSTFDAGKGSLSSGGKYRCTSFNPTLIPRFNSTVVGANVYYHNTREGELYSGQIDGRYFRYTIVKDSVFSTLLGYDVYYINLQPTDANWVALPQVGAISIPFFPYDFDDSPKRGLILWTQTSTNAKLTRDGYNYPIGLGDTFVFWWTQNIPLSVSGTIDLGTPGQSSLQVRPVVFCDKFYGDFMKNFLQGAPQ